MLRQLRAEIDIAKTTEEALAIMLRHNGYDLIISDMVRNGNAEAGFDSLKKFREK